MGELKDSHAIQLLEDKQIRISLHLKNIFAEGELTKEAVAEKISATALDGKHYGGIRRQPQRISDLLSV